MNVVTEKRNENSMNVDKMSNMEIITINEEDRKVAYSSRKSVA
ncbi:hypothetical protein [Ornithinibacillus caprae]|nr:hypothetical protein [Ornithinibacillus caprae]